MSIKGKLALVCGLALAAVAFVLLMLLRGNRESSLTLLVWSPIALFSLSVGLVWALADEETLTMHDHISRTFPTFRETSGSLVRAGRA